MNIKELHTDVTKRTVAAKSLSSQRFALLLVVLQVHEDV